MRTNISDSALNAIRQAADLRAVVSPYVKLQARGTDTLTGLCPFHKEKTPSFNVHPKAGYWKCFGCGAGGNAIGFVQKIEGLSFPEAARSLAEQFSVSIEGTAPKHRFDSADAKNAAAAAEWFWNRMYRYCTGQQSVITDCDRRAHLYLASRVDAADSFGIEYAWTWIMLSGRLYTFWGCIAARIAGMTQMEQVAAFQGMAPQGRNAALRAYRAETALWAKFRGECERSVA